MCVFFWEGRGGGGGTPLRHGHKESYEDLNLTNSTVNKAYDFCIFSKFVIILPIDFKIGKHIDWTYIMYHV